MKTPHEFVETLEEELGYPPQDRLGLDAEEKAVLKRILTARDAEWRLRAAGMEEDREELRAELASLRERLAAAERERDEARAKLKAVANAVRGLREFCDGLPLESA